MENWRLELERWAPDIKVVVYFGAPHVRKALFHEHVASGRFNVLLTTYDYVIKDKSALGSVRWNYLIVDEGHRLKNHASKLHVVFSKHFHTRHRLLLTGTPLQNNLTELWSLLNFLLPTIFNSVANFEEWFNAPFENMGESVAMTEEESLLIINRLHKVLRPFLLRRLKRQVEHQLPAKIEKIIKCAPSALQEVMYKQMTEEGAVLVADMENNGEPKSGARGMMNALMQLRKICNHPYLFHEEYNIDENLVRLSGKFDLLDHLLPKLFSLNHRVLLFSQFTSTMTVLEDFFALRNYPYLRLDGGTKSEDRGAMLAEFNAPNSPYNIFILSTRAGGLGLNLQTADTVILFDSDWNPHMDMQAQDRAHRIGQKNSVLVLRLVTIDSVEEKILDRADYKMGIDAKVIEAGMFDRSSNASKRRSMLCELLKSDRNEKEARSRAPSDDEINRMVARSDAEYVAFTRMDQDRERARAQRWKDSGRSGPPLPRLITTAELPRTLVDPSLRAKPKESAPEDLGRGMRARKDVNYEGVSEAEFLKAVLMSSDDGDGNERRKTHIKIRRPKDDDDELDLMIGQDLREDNGEKSDDEDDFGVEDDDEVNIDDETPGPRSRSKASTPSSSRRKRGRPPRDTPVRRNNDASDEDPEITLTLTTPRSGPAKRRRVADDPMDEEEDHAAPPAAPSAGAGAPQGDQMTLIIERLREEFDEHGRRRTDIFMVLPTRKQYPDYYVIIQKPMDIRTIRKRIRTDPSYSPADFLADGRLIFSNAMVYNLESSQVYEDARHLTSLFQNLCQEYFSDDL